MEHQASSEVVSIWEETDMDGSSLILCIPELLFLYEEDYRGIELDVEWPTC